MSKEVLQIQRHLKKDQIVDTVSRMVKDHDSDVIGGMTEISASWIDELDKLLFQLDDIEKQLADIDINNT